MGLYEGIKDALKLIQKADNIELYSQLIDIQKSAVELLEENKELKDEILKLKSNKELEKEFEHIDEKTYYVHDDGKSKKYICANCWNVNNEYVMMRKTNIIGNTYSLKCTRCKNFCNK